jgi:hypothetical protein
MEESNEVNSFEIREDPERFILRPVVSLREMAAARRTLLAMLEVF